MQLHCHYTLLYMHQFYQKTTINFLELQPVGSESCITLITFLLIFKLLIYPYGKDEITLFIFNKINFSVP